MRKQAEQPDQYNCFKHKWLIYRIIPYFMQNILIN